jgi:anti-sigma factor RsiW
MTAFEHPLSPEELMEYLDGELPIERAAVVQAHVVGCDGCQRLSKELRGISRDMARWQVEDPPATLEAPRPSEPTNSKARSGFGWLRARPALAYSLAALSVVVGVAIVGYGTLLIQTLPPRSMALTRAAVTDRDHDTRVPTGVAGGAGQGAESARPVAVVSGQQGRVTAQQSASRPSIARTARLRVRTTDFDAARPVVDRVVADTGGFVGRVDVTGTRGGARSLTATLHIPANRLDGALAALKAIGLVLDESQSGDDVTEQVVDIEARLSNARNTEKRLVDLLQKRTGDLADVLAAEREIARVREEIERLDGQGRNLARRVTYATLTLEVTEQRQAELDLGEQSVSALFREAFVTGITEAIDTALGLALLVARVGPVLLLWIALLAWPAWVIVRWNRRSHGSA